MNLYDLKTKEDLADYAVRRLVVYSDPKDENGDPIDTPFVIPRNPLRPNGERAAALLDIQISMRNDFVNLVVGVYDLDENGDPIYANSMKPYETEILANNGSYVSTSTGDVIPAEELPEDLEDQIAQGAIMPEFEFWVYYSKNNPMFTYNQQTQEYTQAVGIDLWKTFARTIAISKKLLQG